MSALRYTALMLTYLRYALATFCFAASVGCLALWYRTLTERGRMIGPSVVLPTSTLCLESFGGTGSITLESSADLPTSLTLNWQIWPHHIPEWRTDEFQRQLIARNGTFGLIKEDNEVYFPLWYPALFFALAGVAALRFSRRFTLRSAIIATTVAAGLLGMAVGL